MLKKIIAIGLPLFVLAVAFAGMKGLMSRKPSSKQKERKAVVQPVKVAQAKVAPQGYVVRGLGRTIAAKQVMLQPQVSGLVTSLHEQMTLGGLVTAGSPLLEIDRTDYKLAVRQAAAQVGQAEVRLREEEGRGSVARHEWNLLKSTSDSVRTEPLDEAGRSLALREPQLRSARLNLEAAKASLDQAKLALKRTSLVAPMNSVIVRKNVDTGQRVSPNQTVATLVGTDVWWIQVSLSPSDLRRVNVSGVQTSVFAQNKEAALNARIIRVLPDVEGTGKLARLLIGVDDPMRLQTSGTPLFLGDSVNVVFNCPTPSGLVSLPRKALRSDGTLWTLKDQVRTEDGGHQGSIQFLTPKVFFKSKTLLLVHDLNEGDLIVTSNLSMATQGTQVRWKNEASQNPAPVQPAVESSQQ